jgi:hypothetical protein
VENGLALLDWTELYNERWIIERHQHKSQAQVHREYYAGNTKLTA